jgi:transcriptional regulator with XRE-family HTH domain
MKYETHNAKRGDYMLSKLIKQYIDSHGVTQTFIAKKTGIDVRKINAMLNGNRQIIAEEYLEICDALSVPYDMFKNYKEAS